MELLMIFIVPILVAVLVKKLWKKDLYPKLPDGYEKNDICLVCSLRTNFACCSLVCTTSLYMDIAVVLLLDTIEGKYYYSLPENIMAILAFLVLAIVFAVFMYTIMKNYSLVFLKDGILYRTMLGKVYYYKDSEVVNYRYAYGKGIVINTSDKSVDVSRMATNYDEAIRICAKYTHI